MRKGAVINAVLVLVMAAGLAAACYPAFSGWWNGRHQTRAVEQYTECVERLSEEQCAELLEQAQEYNLRRARMGAAVLSEPLDGYENMLNIEENGMIGSLTVDKINIRIPIFHGTDKRTLQEGCGHLEGSSLPVGGESTHAVLSGHRGLPSARLFTDLDRLRYGDTFTVSVLGRVLTYEVDQIRTVLPTDLNELSIVRGRDYCTLLTCTPYGINTHRLLVRGHRVHMKRTSAPNNDTEKLYPVWTAFVIAVPLSAVLVAVMSLMQTGKKRRKRAQKKTAG